MKKDNKNVQLVLGVGVVLIWGLVVFRFSSLNRSPENAISSEDLVFEGETWERMSDTLQILLNYRDPFLSDMVVNRDPTNTLNPKKFKASQDRTPTVLSPQNCPVQYKGFSQDEKGRLRARLKVYGKGVTLMAGDRFGSLNVLTVTKDSVLIQWEGRGMTLFRSKPK